MTYGIFYVAIDGKVVRDSTAERGQRIKPALNDFTRLNKAVLREGATNAAANRALRANHDLKLIQKTGRNTKGFRTAAMPTREQAFGKPNRPQTPVNGIIHAEYTARSEAEMLERYQ